MKKLTFLFILCTLISCRTSKVEYQKTIIKVDTFRTEKIVHIYDSVKDTLIVENPCDSSGILTRFYSKITIPQGRIIIRSYKGSIKATIDLDSVANVYDSKYKAKYKNEVKFVEKIVVKKVVPVWAIVTILLQSFIIILYFYFRFINPFR